MAAAGGDEGGAELLADVRDVDVEQVGEGVVGLVEEMFVEFGAADDAAAVEGEVFDQAVFSRGQRNGLALAADAAGGGVDFHAVEF